MKRALLLLSFFLCFATYAQPPVITNLHGNFGLGFWLGSTNIYNREAEFRWNPTEKKMEFHDGVQWRLVGSGTGSGFPLTSSVSAANFDITNINTLIANQIQDLDYIDFNLAQTNSLVEGRLYWDANQDTLVLGLTDNVQGDLLQTMFAYVHNAESFTLTKGTVVYLSGATGDKASVKVASYSNDTTSARTMGLVSADIPAGSNGLIVTRGVIRKLNTSAFSPGSILWLGEYGNVQTNRPVAPFHGVFIGVVERANAGNGFIYVQIQNGFELDELHDVNITGRSADDLILYNGTIWTNYSRTNLATVNSLTGFVRKTGDTFTGPVTGTTFLISTLEVTNNFRYRGTNALTKAYLMHDGTNIAFQYAPREVWTASRFAQAISSNETVYPSQQLIWPNTINFQTRDDVFQLKQIISPLVFTNADYPTPANSAYWDLVLRQGRDGATGAKGNDGAANIFYFGEWSATNAAFTYSTNSTTWISYQGQVYRLLQDSSNLTPPDTSPSNWAVTVSRGSDGIVTTVSNLVDRGVWNSFTGYTNLDLVIYAGNTFYVDPTNATPGTNRLPTVNSDGVGQDSLYWTVRTQRGAKGVQGDKGDDGVDGVDGAVTTNIFNEFTTIFFDTNNYYFINTVSLSNRLPVFKQTTDGTNQYEWASYAPIGTNNLTVSNGLLYLNNQLAGGGARLTSSWSIVYSDGLTNSISLALGASNYVLTSMGPSNAPVFKELKAQSFTSAWSVLYSDGSTNAISLPIGASNLFLRSIGTNYTPEWSPAGNQAFVTNELTTNSLIVYEILYGGASTNKSTVFPYAFRSQLGTNYFDYTYSGVQYNGANILSRSGPGVWALNNPDGNPFKVLTDAVSDTDIVNYRTATGLIANLALSNTNNFLSATNSFISAEFVSGAGYRMYPSNSLLFTNAYVAVRGDTNFAYIEFPDGTRQYSAGVAGSSTVTNLPEWVASTNFVISYRGAFEMDIYGRLMPRAVSNWVDAFWRLDGNGDVEPIPTGL